MGANPVAAGIAWIKYALRGDAAEPELPKPSIIQAAGANTMGCSCGGEERIAAPGAAGPSGADGGPGEVTDFTPPPPPGFADGGPGDAGTGTPPPVIVLSDAGLDTPPPPPDAGEGAIPTTHPHTVTSGCPEQCPDRNERAIQPGPSNPRFSLMKLFGAVPAICSVGERFDGVVGGQNQNIPGALISCATFVGTQASYPYTKLIPLLDTNPIFLCNDREGDETPPPSWETRVLTYRGMASMGEQLVLSTDHGFLSVVNPQTGETVQTVNLWEAGWDQTVLPSDINDCRTPPTLGGGVLFDAEQSVLYVTYENKDLKRDPNFLFGAERSLLTIPFVDGQLVTDHSQFDLIAVGRGAVGIGSLGDGEKVVLRFDEDTGAGRPAFIVHLAADNSVVREIPLTGFDGKISSDNTTLVVPAGTRNVMLKTVGGTGVVVVVDVDNQSVSTLDAFSDAPDVATTDITDITCFDLNPADGAYDGCSVSLSSGLEQFVDAHGNKGPRFTIDGAPVRTGSEAADCGDGQGGCVVKLSNAGGVFLYPSPAQ